jgi:protein-disulfide isomerase
MKLLATCLSLLVLASCATVPPPQHQADWTQTVVATPEGGFRMGNPDAPIKLVEFVSMSCPHCATFDAEAHDRLTSEYVKPGRVSLEIRNYVRDPFDVAAALVARCGGPERFFPITRRLLAEQEQWTGKLQARPQADMEALGQQPYNQQFRTVAQWAGLQQSAVAEGLPAAQSDACLVDDKAIERLVSMNEAATRVYPIRGVPSFIINGSLIEGADWAAVEAGLKAAN